MNNIISLNIPPRRVRLSERMPAMIEGFARHRRTSEDVFWLKENAELLNILECTGQSVTGADLAVHQVFFDALEERLTFFPQYYRFLLSIGLDLEDLGLGRGQMERLCAWVGQMGLPETELSDLQRAEARRLLARRGVGCVGWDQGLDVRLRAFIDRPATFALPNKKVAYELTHIVFYLSEYGRRDPELSQSALLSLEYAGLIAYLDQNIDLLAEICIALRQAGQVPSALWESAVRMRLRDFRVIDDPDVPVSDAYHEYLVASWAVAMMGEDDSGAMIPTGRCTFSPVMPSEGALRPMSAALLSMAEARNTNWSRMRSAVIDAVDEDAASVIATAEASSPAFEPFFETFARAPRNLH